jgi:hypothetical protein
MVPSLLSIDPFKIARILFLPILYGGTLKPDARLTGNPPRIRYDSAPTPSSCACFHDAPSIFVEIAMLFGGGILGTVLLIVVIVWLVRRV